MKYTFRKSVIEVIGVIWMPAITCGLCINLSDSDVDNCRNDLGQITRESVQAWLDTHAGDFQHVTDFHASIEDGVETIDIPWANEENDMAYCDATCETE
jgi:hypothetical protein